jgi:hypothetical protein
VIETGFAIAQIVDETLSAFDHHFRVFRNLILFVQKQRYALKSCQELKLSTFLIIVSREFE